jgi:hypothetical protein
MTFARQAGAAVVLVTLTLSLQCAGMAAVIAWARPSFAPHLHRLGAIRSAMLVMRLMTAFIGLHVLEILLRAGFYRWLCFHCGNLRFTSRQAVMPPLAMAMSFFRKHGGHWPGGKHHRCSDVRVVGELPVRHRE